MQKIAEEKSSTPVVVDGLLFLVTDDGTAACLDAATGAIRRSTVSSGDTTRP